MPDLLGVGKGFRLLNYVNKRQPEKQNRLVLSQTIFCWIDWLSGCLIHHKRLMLLLSPLRPAERSILFSEKSVRLSDGACSAASSHAPKKGCGVREVWRSQTCTSGSPFFCFEPVFIIRVNRFCVIKAWIQGAKHSKVGYLASICNAVAMLLGRKSCRADDECRFTLWRSKEKEVPRRHETHG